MIQVLRRFFTAVVASYRMVVGSTLITAVVQQIRDSGVIAIFQRFTHSSIDPLKAQVKRVNLKMIVLFNILMEMFHLDMPRINIVLSVRKK